MHREDTPILLDVNSVPKGLRMTIGNIIVFTLETVRADPLDMTRKVSRRRSRHRARIFESSGGDARVTTWRLRRPLSNFALRNNPRDKSTSVRGRF